MELIMHVESDNVIAEERTGVGRKGEGQRIQSFSATS